MSGTRIMVISWHLWTMVQLGPCHLCHSRLVGTCQDAAWERCVHLPACRRYIFNKFVLYQRLAIDPNRNSVLYFGARSGNGLWKSTDYGKTWKKVTSFTSVGNSHP